ncbi:MAG: hypothetical protein KC620_05265 [Myxococcales bacterium]|nr:hypothetical protein [Myxococcales bacterium]
MIRGAALCLLLAACAVAGCVVPMPIEAEPIEVNLPPYFITEAASPPLNQLIEFDPELEDLIELRSGPIDDPNPDDRIYFRVFVDYRPSGRNPIIFQSRAAGRSTKDLIDGLVLPFEPCADIPNIRFVEEDVHRIELVIADRPFLGDDEELPDEPTPRQALPEGAFKVRLVWFVRLDGGRCAP